MKIQYNIKPKKEWPLKVGDKISIKEDWVDRLYQLDIQMTDCRTGELTHIYEEYISEGYPNCDYGDSIACQIRLENEDCWYAPLDCLERYD